MEVLVFLWVAAGLMLVVAGTFDLFNSKSTEFDRRVGRYAIIAGLFLPVVLVVSVVVFLFYVVRESLRA